MGKLLTVDEVAEVLRLEPQSVRANLRIGAIKGFRINKTGSWRMDEDDLDKFIQDNYSDRAKKDNRESNLSNSNIEDGIGVLGIFPDTMLADIFQLALKNMGLGTSQELYEGKVFVLTNPDKVEKFRKKLDGIGVNIKK